MQPSVKYLLAGVISKVQQQYSITPYMISLNKSVLPSNQVISSLSAVEDIIMVGYPTGLYDTVNNLPIFRKGITSSHPAIDFDNKPEFMIDAACFPGSSGSPVFLYNSGAYSSGQGNIILGGTRLFLLGILHSGAIMEIEGKIVTKEIPMQPSFVTQSSIMLNLGYVIKSNQIDSIKDRLIEILNKK